jgi:hypothetical protein
MTAATATDCAPHLAGSGLALLSGILRLIAGLIVFGRSYPRNLRRYVGGLEYLLASGLAPVALVASLAIPMLAHRNHCGQVPSYAASEGAALLITTRLSRSSAWPY